MLFSLKVTDGPGEQFAFWVYSSHLCHHKHLETDEYGTLRILLQMSFSSVQFSCSVVSDSLRPHEPQHARPPCPSPTPRVHPNPCPLSGAIQPFHLSSSSPALNLSHHQDLFKRVSSSHQVAKELEFQLQHQSFQ